jgi:dTDP-4-dehydrorhamnose 3,5-epimerase
MQQVNIEKFSDIIVAESFNVSDYRGDLVKLKVDPNWPKTEYFIKTNNKLAGTFRGIHFQVEPYFEYKLVYVSSGAITDYIVCVDKRNVNFGKWAEIEITEFNARFIHIPPGYAHGYQTLLDSTIVSYGISGNYSEIHSRTLDFNQFNLNLKLPVSSISKKDKSGIPITDLQ